MRRIAVGALLAIFTGAAAAQQDARPDPADPSAPSPKPQYRSAFSDYRPWGEPESGRWREANEEVGRLAGHVGHADQPKPAPKPGATASGEARK